MTISKIISLSAFPLLGIYMGLLVHFLPDRLAIKAVVVSFIILFLTAVYMTIHAILVLHR